MGKGKRRGEPLAPMRCSCAHRPHLPFRARRRSCRRRDGTRVAVAVGPSRAVSRAVCTTARLARGPRQDPGEPSDPSHETRTGPGRPPSWVLSESRDSRRLPTAAIRRLQGGHGGNGRRRLRRRGPDRAGPAGSPLSMIFFSYIKMHFSVEYAT